MRAFFVPPFVDRQLTRFMGQDAMGNLMQSSAKASAWVGISIGASSVLRLLSNFIMARLLAPEAFGLIGIAFTIQFAVGMLTDIGLNSSVVRSKRGDDPVFLRTIWVTQMARNFLITILIWGVCWALWANREGLPQESILAMDIAPLYIAVAAFQAILTGLESPSVMFAQRNLNLKRVVMMELAVGIIAIPIMIIAATMGAGVWSLLIGTLGSQMVRLVATHTWIPGPRMALEFNREHFSEIFNFGKWLIIASFAGFVIGRGDQLIFGTLFDQRTFSLYVIAGIWIRTIHMSLVKVIRKICLPTIARCRRETPHDIPRVYKRLRFLADGVAMGCFLAMVFGSDLLFTLFYAEDFEPAKRFVPYMAFMLLFVPHFLINQVILAAGDSRNFMLARSITAVAIVVGVPIIYRAFGELPAVLAFSIAGLVNLPMLYWAMAKQVKIDFWTEARILIFAAAALSTLVMFGGV